MRENNEVNAMFIKIFPKCECNLWTLTSCDIKELKSLFKFEFIDCRFERKLNEVTFNLDPFVVCNLIILNKYDYKFHGNNSVDPISLTITTFYNSKNN